MKEQRLLKIPLELLVNRFLRQTLLAAIQQLLVNKKDGA